MDATHFRAGLRSLGLGVGAFVAVALCAFVLLALPLMAFRLATGGNFGDSEDGGLAMALMPGALPVIGFLALLLAAAVTVGWRTSRRASAPHPPRWEAYRVMTDPWAALPANLRP